MDFRNTRLFKVRAGLGWPFLVLLSVIFQSYMEVLIYEHRLPPDTPLSVRFGFRCRAGPRGRWIEVLQFCGFPLEVI